ncbi:chorismate--pyruvate lyase family protein [Thiomicrorhabdus sp.]|uniref:chorismate--pyruvate lyase family protein n=1 Tax=Thiomicrorhabdus sp. TaxID=2039724 RepID=UPI0029C69E45|nr:chorismate lyase [Thiomicrorhabdus sp.]
MSAAERIAKLKALLREKQSASSIQPQFWKPSGLIARVAPTQKIRSWLSTPTSLTARMRSLCPDLEVEILSERYEVPLLSEAAKLLMERNEEAWVRCVLLKCGQNNWVYARTVIPRLDALNPWHELQQLGTQPLGEILFELPNLERSPFEFSKDSLSYWPRLSEKLANPKLHNKPGFARRSVFVRQNAPLLLTEVFLPGLTET